MTDTSNRPQRETPLEALVAPLQPILSASRETKIALTILCAVLLWGIAIATFGVPALVWPMKVIVPSMVVVLVLITMGK